MSLLDKIFRKFTIEKLEAIKTIADYDQDVISTTTISGALTKEGRELGGTLSSLSRTQIDGEPLIIPVGKSSEEGVLWRVNENIATKDEIKNMAETILDENKQYRIRVAN